jgi:hypothetical protein
MAILQKSDHLVFGWIPQAESGCCLSRRQNVIRVPSTVAQNGMRLPLISVLT